MLFEGANKSQNMHRNKKGFSKSDCFRDEERYYDVVHNISHFTKKQTEEQPYANVMNRHTQTDVFIILFCLLSPLRILQIANEKKEKIKKNICNAKIALSIYTPEMELWRKIGIVVFSSKPNQTKSKFRHSTISL